MTTTSDFLTINQNRARYQSMTASEPMVKGASDYYAANIGKVKTADDLVGNYRLLSYALNAYGLGDQINSTALIKQVLNGGVADPRSLANTLADPRWKAFAKAFDFVGKGAASISGSSAVNATTGNYVEQQLEQEKGLQNVGVQLALYFQRVAPAVTNTYGILGDKNLLQVVQTIFGLSPASSASNIDAQASTIAKMVPPSDLQDPAKVTRLAERFTAMYELAYGPSSNSAGSLSASTGTSSTGSAASAILGGIVGSNSAALAGLAGGGAPLFSQNFLLSLQGLRLRG